MGDCRRLSHTHNRRRYLHCSFPTSVVSPCTAAGRAVTGSRTAAGRPVIGSPPPPAAVNPVSPPAGAPVRTLLSA